MNLHTHISHTSEKGLQKARSQAEQSIREAPAQTDQPIRQEEAHPDIKDHLAAAPGNRVELDALSIAKSSEEGTEAVSCNPLEGVEGIQDDTERDAAYLSIVKDPQIDIGYRLKAAQLIRGDTQRNEVNAVCFNIIKDDAEPTYYRLWAAQLIERDPERHTINAVCFNIVKNDEEPTEYRLKAAELIKGDTERNEVNAVCLSIVQNNEVYIEYRLKAAELIKGNTNREEVNTFCLSIAQNPEVFHSIRSKAAEKITDPNMRDEAYLTIVRDQPLDALRPLTVDPLTFETINPYLHDIVLQIQDLTKRDRAYSYIAEDPEVDINDRLEAASKIDNNPIQGESYRSIIETLLSRDAFGCMEQLITVVQGIADNQVKNLVIKAICQNWLLTRKEKFLERAEAFRRLYELASDDGRTDLITAIVTRIEVDAGFRKAVVEEHVKDATEQERLVKAIEEGQEGSLNGPRNKRAW